MFFRLVFFVVFLVSFSTRLIAQCPQDEQSGMLLGVHSPQFQAKDAILIQLSHYQYDLKVFIDDDRGRWLNTPGGRHARDYLFLESDENGIKPRLCIYSVFQQIENASYNIKEFPIAPAAESTLESLRKLNTAAELWLARSVDSVSESAAIYSSLVPRLTHFAELVPELDFDLRFATILATSADGRRQNAIADAELLVYDYERDLELAYKAMALAGDLQIAPSNLDKGIPLLLQALQAIEQAENYLGRNLDTERTEILLNLGEAYITAGRLDEAEQELERALDFSGTDYNLLSGVYNNLGYLFLRKGADMESDSELWMRESTQAHLNGIDYASFAGDKRQLRRVNSNIATHYVRIGELRKALSHFHEVLNLLGADSSSAERAYYYSTLGDYYQILGDYNSALAFLEESLSLVVNTATSNPRNTNLLCRIGTVYRQLGRIDDASRMHANCISDAVAVEDYLSLVEGHLQLSVDNQEQGELYSALIEIEVSLEYLPKVEDNNYHRRSRMQYSRVLQALGKLDQAAVEIEAALALPQNDRHPNDYIAALLQELRVKRARGDINEMALAELANQARDFILQIHEQLEAERLGPAWSNLTNEMFNEVAALYLEHYEESQNIDFLRQAVFFTESSKDVSLMQHLLGELDHDASSLENKNQIERFSEISNQMARAGGQQNAPLSTTIEYYHQYDLLSLARLQNKDTIPIPDALQLDEIESRLSTTQLALYYIVNKENIYVLEITKGGTKINKSQIPPDFDLILSQTERQLHSPGAFPQQELEHLSALLLPDLSQYPEISELLLVNDGFLHSFPFSALSLERNAYVPLISKIAVINIPSLSAYLTEKPDDSSAHVASAAVFADPIFNEMQLVATNVPSTANNDLRDWSENLVRLPNTAREAEYIKTILPTSEIFTGVKANRANLTSSKARNSKILHIATHGYFLSTGEDNMGLALSTIDENGEPDPGFITLSELFSNTFNNELVVISGCETAMGRSLEGVGINGLTRGFLAQGAHHVISTLWPVSDMASAEFMRLFYQNLTLYNNVNSALQSAQNELMRQSAYRHPFYWAPYVLTSVYDNPQLNLQ